MNKKQKEVQQAFLDAEKEVLEQLKKNYQDALDEINTKIAILLGRDDADMSHVMYQVVYQEALKKQVESALNTLQANEFETISDYLAKSYEDGYIGTMYDIQGQGIPIIMPMDQEQVVQAIQHETKLSEGLYKALGKDVKVLSKQIAGEITRGISSGQMYSEIARNIAGYAGISRNKAMRIARTEGHRIQCKATMDAQFRAKEKGADVVKQWDSTLDKRTRSTHRKLDGQIRELDEEFEVGGNHAMMPGGFNKASEDINCRCALLQRARWALDESELETLKKRAEYFELDKVEDFADYKKKYLKAVESDRVRVSPQKISDEDAQRTLSQGIKISKKNHTSNYGIVDRKLVNSKEYHDKYVDLTEHKVVNEAMYQEAMKMLEHRDGTPFEDMVAIDARTGKVILSVTDSEDIGKLTISQEDYDKIVNYNGKLILLHNHPNSSRTSYTDISRLKENSVYAIASVGHDGSISYVYDLKENFDIEKFWEEAYNNYKEIYGDNILAKHYATDLLYELGVFKTESR